MASPKAKQKLTAVFVTDVVGYSRLMDDDHHATVKTLAEYSEVFYSYIQPLLRWLRGVGRRQWSRYLAVALLLTWGGLLVGVAQAAAPALAKPVRIGALNSSWGSAPAVVGLRDGLVTLAPCLSAGRHRGLEKSEYKRAKIRCSSNSGENQQTGKGAA